MTIYHKPNTEAVIDYTIPIVDIISLVVAIVVLLIQLIIIFHIHEIRRSVKAGTALETADVAKPEISISEDINE